MPHHQVVRQFSTYQAGQVVDTSAWRPANVRGLVTGRYLVPCSDPRPPPEAAPVASAPLARRK